MDEEQKSNTEKWLETLEATSERLQREVEERKKARVLYEQRRDELLRQKKMKQEEILRKKQESRERKEKKRMLEERWAMIRWLTAYLDQNQERWNQERIERDKNEKQRAADWHKMRRFEKIRVIKEKQEENRKVTLTMKPSKLTPSTNHDDQGQGSE